MYLSHFQNHGIYSKQTDRRSFLVEAIQSSLEKLRSYVEDEGFKGWDPYDTLNSSLNFAQLGKWVPILAIQFQKRNPVNLRPLLGIKKDYNPKAIGLLLHAYSILYELHPSAELRKNMDFLFQWLCANYSQGYSGYAWGYNFDWSSPGKTVKAFTPSIVVTGFIAKGIFKYYQVTGDEKAVEVLRSACEFVLKDLPRTETSEGVAISYTPGMKDCCFNASMLAAELFSKVFSITPDRQLYSMAKKIVDFTVSYQEDDGHWNYSLDFDTGKQREQIDFHQGYVLDSLRAFIKYTDSPDHKYLNALTKGAEFYQTKQFFENGRSKWRLPRIWPVEIHNQSQGIITFAKLCDVKKSYLDFASTIAYWTIRNMQHHQGHFYYRKNRFHVNKIPFMRWSQAWMMLALSSLLTARQY